MLRKVHRTEPTLLRHLMSVDPLNEERTARAWSRLHSLIVSTHKLALFKKRGQGDGVRGVLLGGVNGVVTE